MSNRILIEPHYWGNIAFFHALITADEVILDINSNFEKASYRNRCNILSPNGKLILSVPVQRGKEQRSLLKDVKISYAENWVKDHWQSLVSSYRRSAYFEYYEDEIWEVYKNNYISLKDLDIATTNLIHNLLKIESDIITTDKFITYNEFEGLDLRDTISPKTKKNVYHLSDDKYQQVFMDRMNFVPQLSILDLLFNLGPRAKDYILNLTLFK
ncbi:MAG: WbqC family protein [Chitinophagales bacterium]|nr:WbqC family protein [Chitinophagales bacterium]